MTSINIAAIIILVVAVAGIILLKLISMKKNNEEITLQSFLEKYTDVIIEELQTVIQLVQTNITHFDNKTQYLNTIINITINGIKSGTKGVHHELASIIDRIDNELLIDCIRAIIDKYEIDIFSVLNTKQIDDNKKLYSDNVIIALAENNEKDTKTEVETIETRIQTDDKNSEEESKDTEVEYNDNESSTITNTGSVEESGEAETK